MRGARHLMVLFAAISIVSACSSGGPAAPTSPSLALAQAASAGPTAAPLSNQPAAVSATPTAPAPTRPAPTAPTTAAPTPTEAVDRPNLIVLKFEVEEDRVLVGVPATLTATVANSGSADAGPFLVDIVLIAAGQADLVLESKPVEGGLGAGDVTELTTSITQDLAGELTLVARVDMSDTVPEEDESDNERVLEVEVKLLGNINVPAGTYTVVPHPDAPGTYLFYFTLVNTGSINLVETISVKFFAYTSSGELVEWGSHDLDLNLAPNETRQTVVAYNVVPDTYRAYVLADPDNTFEESDEGDNGTFFDFTAP